MKMGQVSKSCFAMLYQKNRMCDVNSHLINPGGGVVIDTQLQQDCDFNDIKLALPTTLFDERHELNLDGTEVDLIYVGPCHRSATRSFPCPRNGCWTTASKIAPGGGF